MKYIILLLAILCTVPAMGQKQKPKKAKVTTPIAPPDSLKAWGIVPGYMSLGVMYGNTGTWIYRHGKYWRDTTGMAVEGRKVLIGDTVIVDVRVDTLDCQVKALVGGKLVELMILKVTMDNMAVTWKLYRDTVSGKHYTGNMGMGEMRHMNYQPPYKYLALSGGPVPDEIKIVAEVWANKRNFLR